MVAGVGFPDPCFLCGNAPSQHHLRVQDPRKGAEGDVFVCDTCFFIACDGQDQAIAHLWSALQEGRSKGYTDAGFVHSLDRSLRRMGGFAAVGWVRYLKGEGELEGAFLFAVLPNPSMPSMPPIWCRSRMPMFPALAESAASLLPAYDVPTDAAWNAAGDLPRRFLVAPVPEGAGLRPETNPAIVDAVLTSARAHYGERDFFTLLANEGTDAGFEMIRRFLL